MENFVSTNVSKEKREQLVAKIKAIKSYIAAAPQDENTARLLAYIADIEKDIKGKKYGLVFEEHREKIDEILEQNTPVLTEEKDLFIDNGGQMNFLIEGDNLAALQLLEKTHKGKIDFIYIDPPYNTGTDKFKYDDKIVDINDCFRHSKWASFISKRLMTAKTLLSDNWVIFISIDNNEIASLKMVCDSVFGESNFIGTIDWESKTKSQNTQSAYRKLQPKCEYILCYGSDGTKHKFNLIQIGNKDYNLSDENGVYREHCLEVMNAGGVRGRETMVFDITDGVSTVSLPAGKQWQLGLDQVAIYKERKDLFIREGKVIIKMRPYDERIEKTIPFWAFFDKTIGTAESAKKELNAILGDKHGFDTVKPVELLKRLVFHATENNDTILDFFAGSGTTGHAVMKLNAEDGGRRKFILCTNNENNICRDVTYERIKRVIERDKYEASLKYFKVDFVSISDKLYYEYADELLKHIRELVELENGINFNGNAEIAIVLTEKELDEFTANMPEKCKAIYLGHDVLPSEAQESMFKSRGIAVNIIPDYYYRELEG